MIYLKVISVRIPKNLLKNSWYPLRNWQITLRQYLQPGHCTVRLPYVKKKQLNTYGGITERGC